jgi:hypothetical protein
VRLAGKGMTGPVNAVDICGDSLGLRTKGVGQTEKVAVASQTCDLTRQQVVRGGGELVLLDQDGGLRLREIAL